MSLFTRIIGTGEDIKKIPAEGIRGSVAELSNGELTPQNIIDQYELNAEEQTDLNNFLALLSTSVDKSRTSARVFSYLCLAEMGWKQGKDYTDETNFWNMVQTECARLE